MPSRYVLPVVFSLFFLFAGSANATIVSYAFTGHVTSAPIPNAAHGMVVDAPITGRFSFDDSLTLAPSPTPDVYFAQTDPGTDLEISFGGIAFAFSPPVVPAGLFAVQASNADGIGYLKPTSAAFGAAFASLAIVESSHSVFPTTGIPSLLNLDVVHLFELSKAYPLSVAAIHASVQSNVFGAPLEGQVEGVIDTVTLVPEPSTFLAAIVGIAVLGLTSLRRKRGK